LLFCLEIRVTFLIEPSRRYIAPELRGTINPVPCGGESILPRLSLSVRLVLPN
jgi:hypothetical protein